ncbi:serine hydrolase domain-containing protein [Brevibacterium gallinarum]|uniref:Beta-lactamase family protein n=1 Tax=Brevibacterium gallinarum TaxID=2762220 RepID=A0ABR8WSP0_9MICO|nr:serine hydrolase domain-containing protein [Brevibacterium gallinarum]MBD8019671.1 beta-lactamase family protein [Brevibacterium gallinarum]
MAHSTTPSPPCRRWLWPAAAALATALVLTAFSPLFPRLGAATGDAALGQDVIDALGSHNRHHVAIAQLNAGDPEPRFAGFGADEHTEFEIGSVTKTFTGVLLAQAIEKGEVAPETTLGELFDSAAGAATEVTLMQLSTHTSGLPRLEPGGLLDSLVSRVLHTDPYRKSESELLAGLRDIDTPTPVDPEAGDASYSNYGVALLGIALAEAAGTDYATLLEERIFDPLGMDDTYLPVTRDGLADDAPHGYAAGGVPASAWTLNGSAPAGGIRSTAADMARYVQAVMGTDLAGSELATTRQALLEEDREIGFGWMMRLPEGSEPHVTYHNGGTGGYSAIVGYTPEGDGLIVLSDTTRDVDDALSTLIGGKDAS